MLISKQNDNTPSLLPVLLISGPLVLGQDGFEHRTVQGSLDAESPSIKEVLPIFNIGDIGASQFSKLSKLDFGVWEFKKSDIGS